MQTSSIDTRPVWLDVERPEYPSLSRSGAYDAVIIGGGITGLTAAWLLKRAGQRVAVLEKGRIGGGETGHTTAHLTIVTDTRLKELVRTFGKDSARLAWQAGAVAISLIERIAQQESIECGFRIVPGFLTAPLDAEADEQSDFEQEAELARELGFDATFVRDAPVVHRPGIRFANQALIHPIRYAAGLARVVAGGGSDVFEQTEAVDVHGSPLAVEANGQTLTCDRVIVATHVPLMGKAGLVSSTFLQTKLYAYSSYAISARAPSGTFPEAAFWDTADPYNYLRVHRDEEGELLVLGGEDHKTGQEDRTRECYARLEARLAALAPEAAIEHRWSGQVIETNDGLPFIGEAAEGQFAATGFAGNGLTFGTIAGIMASDWALGRESPWRDLFSLGRTKVRGGTWEYVKENVDFPAHLLKGLLSPSDVDTADEVPAGSGRIARIDGQRCAVYRDEQGNVSICSAICTHMGCVVRWNDAESTWDCPCHGSRFNPRGEVIAGPAESPLKKLGE
ncbi:MAG: FAD-dependent oxidoreductase [Planctomyces sp.]|nr:FAD-dependent oxidoreductase [Planctomyces sp.]